MKAVTITYSHNICGMQYFFLQAVCLFTVSSSFLFNTISEDPYVFYGSQLTLNCSLGDKYKDYNASQIYFTYGKDKHVPPENVTVMSEQTATMNLTVYNMTDFQNVMYNCFVAKRTNLVQSWVITVEYPSRPVSDFHCVVNNWDTMQCDWKLGKYENLNNIDVTFNWISTAASGWGLCKNLTKTSCLLTRLQFPGLNVFQINITVNNTKKMSTAVTSYQVNAQDIVKPAPVKDFISDFQNSTCVHLKWMHKQLTKGLRFQINYTDGKSYNAVTTQQEYTMCGLLPFRNYTFYVRAHPVNTGGFWSDAVPTSIKTAEDVPSVGPNVTSGSYFDNCDSGNRSTVLYFKPPKEEYRNGILTGYNLTVEERETGHSFPVLVDAEKTSAVIKGKCKSSYNVLLFAMTSVGLSTKPSSVTINRYHSVKVPGYFRIEIRNRPTSSVIAKWDALEDVDDTYTVYWCQGSAFTLNYCKNAVEWLTVRKKNSVLLPVNVDDVDNYMFAISRDTSTGSSGLTRSECVYKHDTRPDAPGNIEIAESSSDLTLNVLWNNRRCDMDKKSLLSKYIIHYSHVGNSGSNKSVKVNSSANSYQLTGLEQGNYSVVMQAESESGILSPFSRPVFGVVVDNSLTNGEIFGIVFGSLFALIFVGALIFFLCRNCKIFKKDKIELPSHTKTLFDEHYEKIDETKETLTFPEEIVSKEKISVDTGKTMNRHRSAISTDSGRGSSEESKNNGTPSPMSSTSNHFETVKEEDGFEKITDNEPADSSRPPDYSKFAKAYEPFQLEQRNGTVEVCLGNIQPGIFRSAESEKNAKINLIPPTDQPVSGQTISSYVTVGTSGIDCNQNMDGFVPVINNDGYVENAQPETDREISTTSSIKSRHRVQDYDVSSSHLRVPSVGYIEENAQISARFGESLNCQSSTVNCDISPDYVGICNVMTAQGYVDLPFTVHESQNLQSGKTESFSESLTSEFHNGPAATINTPEVSNDNVISAQGYVDMPPNGVCAPSGVENQVLFGGRFTKNPEDTVLLSSQSGKSSCIEDAQLSTDDEVEPPCAQSRESSSFHNSVFSNISNSDPKC